MAPQFQSSQSKSEKPATCATPSLFPLLKPISTLTGIGQTLLPESQVWPQRLVMFMLQICHILAADLPVKYACVPSCEISIFCDCEFSWMVIPICGPMRLGTLLNKRRHHAACHVYRADACQPPLCKIQLGAIRAETTCGLSVGEPEKSTCCLPVLTKSQSPGRDHLGHRAVNWLETGRSPRDEQGPSNAT